LYLQAVKCHAPSSERKEQLKEETDKLKEEKKNELNKVYGGDNLSDQCPIEAVKYYLNQKLKREISHHKIKKTETITASSMPVKFVRFKATAIMFKYIYYKIIYSLYGIRYLGKLEYKIKNSYKGEKISQQQYKKLEYDISSFYEKRYGEVDSSDADSKSQSNSSNADGRNEER
jgi:hypothetical protein